MNKWISPDLDPQIPATISILPDFKGSMTEWRLEWKKTVDFSNCG